MDSKEYIKSAIRTESKDLSKIYERLEKKSMVRILHAGLGVSTEAGELLDAIKKDLLSFRVRFDNWFSQEELEKGGAVDKLLDVYRSNDELFEKEGATWFKSKNHGDVYLISLLNRSICFILIKLSK